MDKAFREGFLHCKYIHQHSCEYQAMHKFVSVMNIAWKFYLPIHVIPLLIFKRKRLREAPKQTLKQVAKNLLLSCLFLSTYITIFRYLTCFTKNYRQRMDKWNIIISGFFATFAIMFEPSHRRTELALYLFPRFLEALWNWLEKRGFVKSVPNGEVLIFAMAMSIIMYCY